MRADRPSRFLIAIAVLSASLAACSSSPPGRRYELRGQILAVNRDEGTVTIRHGDIENFMPAMTMPFKVKDRRLLDGRTRGDLVKGTLVVSDTEAYLDALDLVGHGEVPDSTAPAPASANVLEPGSAVPDAELLDVNGRAFRFSSLRGSTVALTFIYTRCPLPQYCPLINRQFAAVAARVRDDARLRQSVRLLSISFDPEYDTPVVLKGVARALGADGTIWRFATADRPTVDAFAPRFGVVVMRESDGSITHNLRTAIVDRQGRLVRIYSGSDWTPDDMAADLKKAVAE